jgi:methyl-accepting chemotaxis protein
VNSVHLSIAGNSPHSLSRSAAAGSADRKTAGFGIQRKIYGIVALLALLTLAATAIGFTGMRSYHDQVAAMTRASETALLGERIDALVTAVVMDSRGIYMAADKTEAEKFSPALMNNLGRLQELTAQWLASAPDDRRQQFTAAADKVSEFIGFRTELVRLARENSVPEARAFGDNAANRSNRSGLNKVLSGLVHESSARINEIDRVLEDFYRGRILLLVGLCLVGLAVGIATAVFAIRRGVVAPLTDMVGAVSTVADGNL